MEAEAEEADAELQGAKMAMLLKNETSEMLCLSLLFFLSDWNFPTLKL